MENTIQKWLYNKGIFVPLSQVSRNLREHPHYPSLLSLTDVISNYDPSVTAFTFEKINLAEINYPLILHLKEDSGEGGFLFIPNQKKLLFNLKNASGIMIGSDCPKALSWKKRVILFWGNLKWMIEQNFLPLLFLLPLCFLIAIYKSATLGTILTLSWAGLYISWQLSRSSLEQQDSNYLKVCKTESCNEVLKVVEKKLPFGLNLGDMAVSYFIATLVSTFCWPALSGSNDIGNSGLVFICFMGLIVAAVSICTMIYLRKYCSMCLVLDAILICQMIVIIII